MSTVRLLSSRPKPNWQPFSNVRTLASYHFDLQQVFLDSVEQPIVRALSAGAPAARYKIMPLAAHEYTHWVDNVASLWGRRLLYHYYRGLVARERDAVSEFQWIVRARSAIVRCKSSQYYFQKGPKSGAPAPWKWGLAIGSRFDSEGRIDESDPICFVRFGTDDPHNQRHLIARIPISPASLAEVRAMESELCWIENEFGNRGEGKTPADPRKWLAEFSALAYRDDYLLYTTALHLLANHCAASSIGEILRFASSLAWVSLNFPESMLSRITVPTKWSEYWKPPRQNTDLIESLLTRRDPGFVFTLLCNYASRPLNTDVGGWIASILQEAGVGTLADYEEAWLKELEESSVQMCDELDDERFRKWMEVGELWAQRIGPLGSSEQVVAALDGTVSLPLPDSISGDDTVWNPGGNFDLGDGKTTLQRAQYLDYQRDRMDEFLAVCGL